MASTAKAKQEAFENLMPMLHADSNTVDIRIGRNNHMAFIKLDPVAIANYLATEADEDFVEQFTSAWKRYGGCPDG